MNVAMRSKGHSGFTARKTFCALKTLVYRKAVPTHSRTEYALKSYLQNFFLVYRKKG